MDKRFLGILAGLAAIFIAIAVMASGSGGKSTSGGPQATNHVMGGGQKAVTLIEYGDYQCPVCEAYYLPVKQAVAQYLPDIHFQFRNLPLVSVHPNAFSAARAAEATGLQNKYWEMHDMLYEASNWRQWTTNNNPLSLFDAYAKQLGLNVEQFKKDYFASKVNDAINADLAAFKKTGKDQATPTFFLNGTALNNPDLIDSTTGPSADKIGAVIKAEIDKKNTSNKN